MACRIEGVPRTIMEISLASGMSKSELGVLSFDVARKLHLQLRPVLPEQFVNRICTKISLPLEYQDIAVKVCQNVTKAGLLNSVSASTIAASVALVISLGCGRTQRLHLLEEASFSTVGKIRKCYSVLYSFLATVLPSKLPTSYTPRRLPDVLGDGRSIVAEKLFSIPGQESDAGSFPSYERKRQHIFEFDTQHTHKNRKRKQPCVWKLSSLYESLVVEESRIQTASVESPIFMGEISINYFTRRNTYTKNNHATFSTEYATNGWKSLKRQKDSEVP